MRAIIFDGKGGSEVIKIVEKDRPRPKEKEVLIKIKAAGVNRTDVIQREGHYDPPPGVTAVPGLEVSGVIVDPGSSSFKMGEAVCALVSGGGYAEYVAVDQRNVILLPKKLTWEKGGGLMETFMTVWGHLFQFAGFSKGKSILIHGGASGIGTTAIQLTRAFGATSIFTTVSREEDQTACETLGADQAINYKTQDFVEEIKKSTSGKGVDFILDIIGGDYVQRNYAAAASYGKILQVGVMQGKVRNLNLFPMLAKRLTHLGTTLRSQTVEQKAQIIQSLKKEVWPLLDSGKIKPLIDRTFPLEEAKAAHDHLEHGKHFGKVVLINK